jgi:branched-chain amino acid transport system substrate-binding protein
MRRIAAGVVMAVAVWALPAGAQSPLRIGASLSQTGSFAALGQNQLRGYQLCVKHANEKGGVLGRKVELFVEDDHSRAATAVAIYERLVARDRVDAILGPYSSPLTEAVADIAETHRMAMVAPGAAATSVFKKGRRFVFQVFSPAEAYLEGLVEVAHKHGLRTIAIVNEDTIFTKSVALGTAGLAKKRGMQVVLQQAYPKGQADFAAILGKVRALSPDVLAAATYFDDAVAIARQLKEQSVSPKIFGVTVGGDLPRFYETLGKAAEFVYGASQWEPELVSLRAGGLVPIARQYPGAREFVEDHTREFVGADLSYHTAAGYGGCQILLEALRRAGALDGEKVRDAILKLDINTAFGGFRVDRDGLQTAHRMVTFQWQDGKKVIVWPEDLAPGKPRFPTPPWNQR